MFFPSYAFLQENREKHFSQSIFPKQLIQAKLRGESLYPYIRLLIPQVCETLTYMYKRDDPHPPHNAMDTFRPIWLASGMESKARRSLSEFIFLRVQRGTYWPYNCSYALCRPSLRAFGKALGLSAANPDMIKLTNFTDPTKTSTYFGRKTTASSATGDFAAVLHEVLVSVRMYMHCRLFVLYFVIVVIGILLMNSPTFLCI